MKLIQISTLVTERIGASCIIDNSNEISTDTTTWSKMNLEDGVMMLDKRVVEDVRNQSST